MYGVNDPAQFDHRVPTFLFNLPKVAPGTVVEKLAARGNRRARWTHVLAAADEAAGTGEESGAVRASLVHYNTSAEIQKFREILQRIARSA